MAKKRRARNPRRKSFTERKVAEARRDLARKAQKLLRCDDWPLRECLINETWVEAQMASIVIARDRPDGTLAGGMCLVDLGCLGVKEAYTRASMSWGVYTHMRRAVEDLDHGGTVDCDPALALKIIEAARDFGQGLGFEQAKETPLLLALFKGYSAEASDIEVECGTDGVPNYIQGPGDDSEAILKHLNETLGQDGYILTVREFPFSLES